MLLLFTIFNKNFKKFILFLMLKTIPNQNFKSYIPAKINSRYWYKIYLKEERSSNKTVLQIFRGFFIQW